MKYDRLLESKKAVVTWAGSAVGAAIVKKFAAHGAAVAFGVPDAERGDALLHEIRPLSAESFYVVCDLTDGESVEAFMKLALSRFGSAQVLVNSPEAFAMADFLTCTEEDIETMLHSYQRSTMQTIRALSSGGMLKEGYCSIVNVSSSVVRKPLVGAPLYAAGAGTLGGLTRVAALEFSPRHVRVNELQAGLGADPDKVADVALFLASDMARYITAQTITADGGRSMELLNSPAR